MLMGSPGKSSLHDQVSSREQSFPHRLPRMTIQFTFITTFLRFLELQYHRIRFLLLVAQNQILPDEVIDNRGRPSATALAALVDVAIIQSDLPYCPKKRINNNWLLRVRTPRGLESPHTTLVRVLFTGLFGINHPLLQDLALGRLPIYPIIRRQGFNSHPAKTGHVQPEELPSRSFEVDAPVIPKEFMLVITADEVDLKDLILLRMVIARIFGVDCELLCEEFPLRKTDLPPRVHDRTPGFSGQS
ncbi:hypothetical protein GE09DRAFT_1130419 [Coniochaeta sp. 2T2.1]|nr:hypothetical protein GE09DRAFT_1130419 [Coniochaeta sp. 2T2.1]